MAGIYSMMDISRWALVSFTNELSVISHNVSNVDTEGYSRQSAVLVTNTPERTSAGSYGTGVSTSTVIQHVDTLLTERITSETSDLEYAQARLSQLQRLEALANEASDTGLGDEITEFFNAWQDLSNSPSSSAVRSSLLETANSLAERFQAIAEDIMAVQQDLDGYISDGVDQVNSICRNIADLNSKIQQAEVTGHTANDYRDERTRQLNELASYLNISWYEDNDGMVHVQTSGGKTLVQGTYPEDDDADPLNYKSSDGSLESSGGLTLDSEEISGGQLGAWLQVRDEDIEDMLDYMNDLAETLIFEVNKLHASGSGLEMFSSVTGTYQAQDADAALNSSAKGVANLVYGDEIENGSFDIWVYESGTQTKTTINVAATDSLQDVADAINAVSGLNASVSALNTLTIHGDDGVTFGFANDSSNVLAAVGINTFFSGSTTTSIAVNSTIANDTDKICAGRIDAAGDHSEGDNSLALDLADLKDADTMDNGTQTFNDSIISWAAGFGTTIANCQDDVSYAEESMTLLENLRDSVSGVSIDEEMVMLIQYQRSYQMAAQMIKVSDELLQSLLQLGS